MFLLGRRCVKTALTLAVLLTLALAGCGLFKEQPDNLDELESARTKDEHLQDLKSWIFPSAETETARRAFVSRCVAQAGGSYEEASQNFQLETALTSGLTRDQLRKTGYDQLGSTHENQRARFDQAGQEAYFGNPKNGTISVTFMEYSTGEIPIDGCMAQSYQYMYGSVQEGMIVAILAPSFAKAVADEVSQDQSYVDLKQEWSDCMSEADYKDLVSVDQAWDLAQKLEGEEEQKLAEQDAQCREEVKYEEKMAKIQNSYYEAVYQRVKRYDYQLEGIHGIAQERLAADQKDPKNSSPIDLSTQTATPQPAQE